MVTTASFFPRLASFRSACTREKKSGGSRSRKRVPSRERGAHSVLSDFFLFRTKFFSPGQVPRRKKQKNPGGSSGGSAEAGGRSLLPGGEGTTFRRERPTLRPQERARASARKSRRDPRKARAGR